MRNFKKFLLMLLLMLFMPMMVIGCGENSVTKISAKNGTYLTSWEIDKEYDYSTMVIIVEYKDGTKKEISPSTEGVTIENIDTSTSGEKK